MFDLAIGAHGPAHWSVVGRLRPNNAPLYVCQALYGGGLVPGKTRSDWDFAT